MDTNNEPDAPWRIFADQIHYDKKSKTYTAEGNVTLKQNNRKITADKIIYNTDTMKAYAAGNVVVTSRSDILTGERIEMDLNNETGTIHGGHAFFETRHFHIRGDKIRKTGDETYAAEWASITSCDGESPAWKLTGKDLNLSMEGYATAWHTTLWFKQVPVFYSPFFVIPINQERQSGLLRPEVAISSKRKGFEYAQPFFWAISPSTDATLYWDYLEKRGNRWGAEFRYVLDSRSRGTVMFDYLDDQKIDDGTGDSSDKWGYTDDDYLRTNRGRYWFRMKHDQGDLPLGFTSRVDLDIVSDQDYLREFKEGIAGFNASDGYFFRNFGRDLDDYDDTIRRNIVNLTRNWPKYRLNTGATWFDNITPSDNDFTIQQLPWINFSGSKQKVFQTPLFYTLNTGYSYFYRQDGDENHNITGLHHTNLYPRVFLPMRAGNFFTIEPSAGWRYNYWNINAFENDDPGLETSVDRNIYDIGVGLGSEVFRVYDIGGERIDKIKHSIRPKIAYTFIPEVDQDDIPDFSEIEPIDNKNIVSYSITSTFTSKLKRKRISKGSESFSQEYDDATQYDYHDFLRIFLEQNYDFNETNDNKIENPEPFSPLYGEIRFYPSPYLWGLADIKWDFYDNQSVEENVEVIIQDKRGDRLHARYSAKGVEDDQRENLNFFLRVAMTNRLSAHARYEQDLIEKQAIKRGLGWAYRADCWTFSFDYLEEAEDRRYSFAIFLHGLGGFQQSINDDIGSGN
ncbi:MAG: LPS assembly protein LptD [Thermodesulfobacteriota bacterium]|nr:LPS assembly protein LptD [Thermodesulfobacteriota bacterium]